MRKIECFKIRILESNIDNVWHIEYQKPILNILCNHHLFSFNPIVIVADPFLFAYKDRLYLFYEMKRNYSFGVICMTYTEDLLHWSKPSVVLKENFHLSYPFVFEDNGSIFMIPETSAVGDICLYKADDDNLTHFSLYKTLVHRESTDKGNGYADSSVYKKDGLFYLFSSIERNGENIQYLFTSDKITGPYCKHPSSPICSGQKYGRCGGSVLKDVNGSLYRIAQDCEKRYGDNVHLFQIDVMSVSDYKEHLFISNIIPKYLDFYKEGGHQYNYALFKGKYIVATDAKEYNIYPVCRFFHKIGLMLKIIK